MLYSQSALRQTLGEREQMLEIAYNLLEDWRSRLPTLLREMYKPHIHRVLDDEHLRYIIYCITDVPTVSRGDLHDFPSVDGRPDVG